MRNLLTGGNAQSDGKELHQGVEWKSFSYMEKIAENSPARREMPG